MIRKYLLVFFLVALESACLAQDFKIKEDIAYVNDIAYVKVVKSKKRQYRIYSLETKELLLIINLFKGKQNRKIIFLPRVFYVDLNENMEFEVIIKKKIDIISFIYKKKLISIKGKVNEKMVIDYLNSREYYYLQSANQN